jgi:DNA mismatch endonuclease, patch repair protein
LTDTLTSEARSRRMAGIRGKDTRPELAVRSTAHNLGYRFRLHRRDLPGTPDLVFPGRRKVVFVHGCFWHRHSGCKRAATPADRRAYWQAKFDGNVERDIRKEVQLLAAGWDVLIIWECETRDIARLTESLRDFLDPQDRPPILNPIGSSSAGHVG